MRRTWPRRGRSCGPRAWPPSRRRRGSTAGPCPTLTVQSTSWWPTASATCRWPRSCACWRRAAWHTSGRATSGRKPSSPGPTISTSGRTTCTTRRATRWHTTGAWARRDTSSGRPGPDGAGTTTTWPACRRWSRRTGECSTSSTRARPSRRNCPRSGSSSPATPSTAWCCGSGTSRSGTRSSGRSRAARPTCRVAWWPSARRFTPRSTSRRR